MQVLGRVPEIDMLVYHLGFHPISRWGLGRLSLENFVKPAIAVMKEARRTNAKPLLLALRPPQGNEGMTEFLAAQRAFVEAGFPVFYSMRLLARALVTRCCCRRFRWLTAHLLSEIRHLVRVIGWNRTRT